MYSKHSIGRNGLGYCVSTFLYTEHLIEYSAAVPKSMLESHLHNSDKRLRLLATKVSKICGS